LKKVDKVVADEFGNLGLSRKKNQTKELSPAEVYAIQARAHERVMAVVTQAIRLGVHVGPAKAL